MGQYRKIIVIILLSWVRPVQAESLWRVECFTAAVSNIRTPLTVRQSGYGDINITARYSTKPFERPLYYTLRLSRWNNHAGWAFELIHHKLFLTNKPDEIQEFSISHGYNILTVNRGWNRYGVTIHFGGGIVLAHPESTVRNKKLSETRGLMGMGYYVTGPVMQMAAGKIIHLSRNLYIMVEGKLIGAYASIPVADGDASVPNIGIHGIMGIGYMF